MDLTHRDSLVYEAERVLNCVTVPTEFRSAKAATEFVRAVQGTRFFRNRWPTLAKRKIVVKSSRRFEWAGAKITEGVILCHPFHMNNLYMLHELAHFCSKERIVDHGPTFCGSHIALVERFISKSAGKSLRKAYEAYNIDYKLP